MRSRLGCFRARRSLRPWRTDCAPLGRGAGRGSRDDRQERRRAAASRSSAGPDRTAPAMATVVTPNAPRQRFWRESRCGTPSRLGRRLGASTPGTAMVIVKGGHLDGERPTIWSSTGGLSRFFRACESDASHARTGCTFSAAIAACLARGMEPLAAAREARAFLQGAIEQAEPLGAGHGPVNHFWRSSNG